MKRITEKQKAELLRRRKVKAKLLDLCPTDSAGRYLCPQCGKLPDFRGLQLCHEIPLSQGGRTSFKNCYLGCAPCHGGPDGHRTENVPHGQAVDKSPVLSGYHGTSFGGYSKEQQCGIPRKRRSKSQDGQD